MSRRYRLICMIVINRAVTACGQNSKTIVHNYGAELELLYMLNNHYSIFGNGSYQTLKRTKTNDGLEDGFNTPKWMVNGGVRGNNVYKNLGLTYPSNIKVISTGSRSL